MKSFVWLTTIFLLCNQLVYAAHITPIHAHREHRRTPTRSSPESLRRRANRVCKPPNTNISNPGRVDIVNNGGFPSLGFKMPGSVPSSLDGWWSDQRSEIGFLGFSYSVSGCMLLCDASLSWSTVLTVCDFQARVLVLSRASSRTSETSSTADTSVCTAHATETDSSASSYLYRVLVPFT